MQRNEYNKGKRRRQKRGKDKFLYGKIVERPRHKGLLDIELRPNKYCPVSGKMMFDTETKIRKYVAFKKDQQAIYAQSIYICEHCLHWHMSSQLTGYRKNGMDI